MPTHEPVGRAPAAASVATPIARDEPPTTTPLRPRLRNPTVPPALALAGAWSWRLLVIGAVMYFVGTFLAGLLVLVVPLFLAIMFAALLQKPTLALRRRMPRAAAGLLVLLGGLVVIGGVAYVVVWRVSAQATRLSEQATSLLNTLQTKLQKVPGVGLQSSNVVDQARGWVQNHFSDILSGAFAVGTLAADLVTAAVLTGFLTLFFLIDGDRMFAWLVRLLPRNAQQPANGAARRSFRVLSGWISGTAIIALIHGVVIGVTLYFLGTPIALVLAILVFIGSFIPILGAFVFGGFAVVVTLITQGALAGVILLIVLLIENLLEGHVYQPFIMGKTLSLHPVAILVVLALGQLTGGIFGAVVAVPVAAALHAGVKYLTGVEDINGNPLSDEDRTAPIPPLRALPRSRST